MLQWWCSLPQTSLVAVLRIQKSLSDLFYHPTLSKSTAALVLYLFWLYGDHCLGDQHWFWSILDYQNALWTSVSSKIIWCFYVGDSYSEPLRLFSFASHLFCIWSDIAEALISLMLGLLMIALVAIQILPGRSVWALRAIMTSLLCFRASFV